MSNRYDEAYEIVVNMARAKMTMNAHKGRIEQCTPEQISEFCKGEVDELFEALGEGEAIKIIEEAADVVNFAVAAVQQALDAYRTRKDNGHHDDQES